MEASCNDNIQTGKKGFFVVAILLKGCVLFFFFFFFSGKVKKTCILGLYESSLDFQGIEDQRNPVNEE